MSSAIRTALAALAVVLAASAGSATDPARPHPDDRAPLPRWREGGTPPPPAERPLVPYAIDLSSTTRTAPTTGTLESPPEYAPQAGVLFRYSTGAWPEIVLDLVAALTGDPADDEIAWVVLPSDTVLQTAQSLSLIHI